ncbi:TALD3 protein, partial [Nothocercus julius]|nr:TALD3 protein [Nothocercus julius]
MEEGDSSISQDSLASFTAGDVLIHSTSLHKKQHAESVAGAGGCVQKVKISVKKLREVVSPCQASDAALAREETSHVPPALPANRTLSGSLTEVSPCGTAPGIQTTEGHLEHQLSFENSTEDMFLSQMVGKVASYNPRLREPCYLRKLRTQLLWKTYLISFPTDDVLISQYAAGQKEALRVALKQKTQNNPGLKEVKVQLLGNSSTEKQENVGQNTGSTHREVDSTTTIAAATAAAIAATAPLLKVQNDLEAKVSTVSALIDKLQGTDKQLQRGSEQQTNMKTRNEKLHCHERVSELEKQMNSFLAQRIEHLEKLQQQQMNIQSHLISSAVSRGGLQQLHVPSFSLMTKQFEKPEQHLLHHPVPSCQTDSFPAGGPPAQGGGKLLEHILNSQETPLRQIESSENATLNSNKMTWHSKRDRPTALRADSFPALENSFQNSSSIEKTVKKADDLLQDLGQLRREMHNMLQEANSWKLDMDNLIKSKKTSLVPELSEHQVVKPSILHKVKAPKSMLQDAERILRGVQNNKKVLEENLEAITRAKDGDAMYTFINALTTNSEMLEEIRIRKTVDEWIKAISLEIQTELARNDSEQVKCDQKAPWIKRTQNTKAMKNNKEIKAKTQKIQGFSTQKSLSAAKPLKAEVNMRKQTLRTSSSEGLQKKEKKPDGLMNGSAVVQDEEYLCQVYGKPIYQGHRSTLKKAPYLRFNSPSPKSKPPRPKVIERVRGTKVKSARTQTCSHTQKIVTSPKKQHPLPAPSQEKQYLFSPSRDMPADCGPLEGHLIPMAIPLGQIQISDVSLQPAGVVIGKPHPVTVTTSLPPVPPKPAIQTKKANIAVIEMRSEKKDPPQLSVQVLPNVDIDSISSGSVSVNHELSGSETAFPPVNAVIQTPEDVQNEEEDINYPGTNFIDVTDVVQDQEEESDEIPEFCEPLLELNGQFKVASPKYNGPLYPPVSSAPQQSSDILDELIQRRETIENRLIHWVEQEIMAKIISGMFPVQKEVVPSVSTSESEDNETVTSDIVEVAGDGGFQLFVNAGVPVNSEVISQFVNDALSETIATMLGNRQAAPATTAVSSTSVVLEPLLPTPLPTPQATPPQTPPSEKELPPVKTPESSPSITEMSSDVHEREKMKETGRLENPAATSRAGTPVVTPASTPPRITTPSPPASEGISAKMDSPKLPNPWDDAELPLEEEKPSPLHEEPFYPRAVVMSVANDEEPEALILPSRQSSVKPPASLPCEPQVSSPLHTDSSGQSTEESSLTLTETETADRPISEGEVLFSYGQMVAARAGGLSLPAFTDSLTSTLRDANEMDFDPPSEGQVVKRPHKGYYRDPVLTLFAKLNQAPVAAREQVCHLEDSDDSVGEISEGQRPTLTRAAENILMGYSVYMDCPPPSTSESRNQGFRASSPGQFAQSAAEIPGDADSSHGPMLMTELESQPVSSAAVQAAQGSCRVTSLSKGLSQEGSQGAAEVEPVRPRVIHVRAKCEEMQQEGRDAVLHLNSPLSAAKVSVKLPSMNIDDQTRSISSIHGDSDSSGADTF